MEGQARRSQAWSGVVSQGLSEAGMARQYWVWLVKVGRREKIHVD